MVCKPDPSSRWLLLALVVFVLLALCRTASGQEAPLPTSSVPATMGLPLILSSLTTSELFDLLSATLDAQEAKSQADRLRYEIFILSSSAELESAMLSELNLKRTISRLNLRLTAAMKAIESSEQSAGNLSDATQAAIDEARKLLVSRNVWRMTALVTGTAAIVLGVVVVLK